IRRAASLALRFIIFARVFDPTLPYPTLPFSIFTILRLRIIKRRGERETAPPFLFLSVSITKRPYSLSHTLTCVADQSKRGRSSTLAPCVQNGVLNLLLCFACL
ncbi:hypothetical protein BDB00DRAFT_933655, partial [Zychaea mexicana]|uniref:uncharacterized protein n=1 Tax=Zychaea mexicana TaxID=64656 RepID=UPI0022FE2CEC